MNSQQTSSVGGADERSKAMTSQGRVSGAGEPTRYNRSSVTSGSDQLTRDGVGEGGSGAQNQHASRST